MDWIDRVDNVDFIFALDVNSLAEAINNNEEAINTANARINDLEEYVPSVGNLTDLTTTAKNNTVAAINEVNSKVASAVIHQQGFINIDAWLGIPEEYFNPDTNKLYHNLGTLSLYDIPIVKPGDSLLCTGLTRDDVATPADFDSNTGMLYVHKHEFALLSGYINLAAYVTTANLQTVKNELQNEIAGKQDNVAIVSDTSSTTATLEMVNNTEKRYSELTSLTLTLPNTISYDYISSVIFTSGSAATNLVYPNTINMNGEDCNNGVFEPVANKRYTVILSYDGVYVAGTVGGVSTS